MMDLTGATAMMNKVLAGMRPLLLQALPQLMRQSMAGGQRVAQEALTKHRAALRERGINL